ncbi:helix-turn-helix transcriptional regulator [Nocardioides jejuensis]|nr:helix-turn-helix domain-containing protein [Nocardioides jejuensis]
MKKPEGSAEGLTFMLTTSEVAKRLQVSPSTLSRWRATGIGPKVYWISQGSPRYREDDVMAWLEGLSV